MTRDLRKSHEHPRAFDAVLFAVACIGIVVAVLSFRAGGAWDFLGFLAVFGEGLLLYGTFIETRRLTITRYHEALVPKPSVWVTAIVLSDTHAGGFRNASWFERISREVAALHPDLILFDGDAVVDRAEPVAQLSSFQELEAPLGKFFVLGNHDFMDRPQDIRAALGSFGFTDLTNTSVRLEKQGRVLELGGIDDHWFGSPRFVKRTSPDMPHVTLSHEPDILLDLKERDTDLVLSGHTHGGQVVLPILGPMWPVPTNLGRASSRGRILRHGIPCIISNGLGESDGRSRLFSPPEIVVIELGI